MGGGTTQTCRLQLGCRVNCTLHAASWTHTTGPHLPATSIPRPACCLGVIEMSHRSAQPGHRQHLVKAMYAATWKPASQAKGDNMSTECGVGVRGLRLSDQGQHLLTGDGLRLHRQPLGDVGDAPPHHVLRRQVLRLQRNRRNGSETYARQTINYAKGRHRPHSLGRAANPRQHRQLHSAQPCATQCRHIEASRQQHCRPHLLCASAATLRPAGSGTVAYICCAPDVGFLLGSEAFGSRRRTWSGSMSNSADSAGSKAGRITRSPRARESCSRTRFCACRQRRKLVSHFAYGTPSNPAIATPAVVYIAGTNPAAVQTACSIEARP